MAASPPHSTGSTVSPYPIRTITPDEFDGWYRTAVEAFHGNVRQESLQDRREIAEYDRATAAFDGDTIAGTAGAYTFRMAVPGGALPTAGVTEVTVPPSYRRRGVLRSLMHTQLADVASRGEPLAALYASEAAIYGRFGYACAAWSMPLRLHRGEERFVRGAPADPALAFRVTEPGNVRDEVAHVFREQSPRRPGEIERGDAWWGKTLHDPDYRQREAGPRRCVLAHDSDRSRGYALYRVRDRWADDWVPDQELTIEELHATDPAAYAELWRHLLERDLVGAVVARGRPVDDPLLRLLADPRRAHPRLVDHLWLRIVDVGPALAGRSYSRPVDLVLDVDDDTLPDNAGRWRLAGDENGATCARTSDAADVTLSVNDLAAAYLGGGSFADAAAAGLARENRPGALRILSSALRWDSQPWCSTGY